MNLMKFIEILMRYFPLFHLLIILFSFAWAIIHPTIYSFLNLFFCIYLVPLLTWKALRLKIKLGKETLGNKSKKGSAWLISHYLQYNFICFPAFERVLIIIPGGFSTWLRLWGSHIGKKVIWAPTARVYDRSLIEVDDYSFIGGETLLGSHFLIRQKGELSSYIQKVSIGKYAIIGAQSSLGPGTKILDHDFLPAHSRAMKGHIERGSLGKTTRS